jgi:hypothetical protein
MMKIYLKEKIGNPDLFTGRKKELTFYLKWIDRIKTEISPSMAILSRRKTGKTALLQRLFNLTFEKNNGVIPFYFEVEEGKKWAVDFSIDFFLTFLYQYIAFKTRKSRYLTSGEKKNLEKALEDVKLESLDYLSGMIENVKTRVEEERVDSLWSMVRNAPRMLAEYRDERVVQFIDEFQYLNSEIYWDKEKTRKADDFAAGYMSTAEYKNAPLLVAGSWVGWLRYTLLTMLPSRFIFDSLENLPEDEAVEMCFKYSQLLDIPITEETAYLVVQLSEGNPFYISSLFHSMQPEKDLTTREGLLNTLNFETLDNKGIIKGTWLEYISSTFARVNERNAKNIVLYLSKNRHTQVSRKELLEKLKLNMTDFELEQKLQALVKSDIINQGKSNFYYQGVTDNIFDKVFRGIYADDIEEFDEKEIIHDYQTLFEKSEQKYRKLLGLYNYSKGLFAEFAIINQLRLNAFRSPDLFLSITDNLPGDFKFVQYESVWSYKTSCIDKRDIEIDVFARAGENEYSIICEVKNRDKKPFSREEAGIFLQKVQALREIEQVEKSTAFVFSRSGFTTDAIRFFKTHRIAWSDHDRWLG